MILDASGIVAVILGQAESAVHARALLADAPSAVGAPTLAEAALVLQARLGPQGLADLHGFLVKFDVHAGLRASRAPATTRRAVTERIADGSGTAQSSG